MSSDVFVFVAQHRAPSEVDLQTAVSTLDGIFVDVNVPPMDLTIHETTWAYVAYTIGAFRIDTITYRGGDDDQRKVAALLDRFYSQVPALADPDSDGIFTIPELVTLMRTTPYASFFPRADPTRRPGDPVWPELQPPSERAEQAPPPGRSTPRRPTGRS